jgi:hypothetical protein
VINACVGGWADCDHITSNGCETLLGTTQNCGHCNDTCANGLCDPTIGQCACNNNTCTNGCCNVGTTGVCLPFSSQDHSHCGSGGATCIACQSTMNCSNGLCF